jgi:glycine dehydrogenase subunit 1
MPYIPNTPSDQQAMLDAIGVGSMDDLFAMIPEDSQLKRPLDLPHAMSELELQQHMASLADLNVGSGHAVSFLGGGCYDHFIPSVVDFVASRSEFYTAYTPYQAEASQGTLQAIFEYQTLICRLTGMDVSNAGMYDGATAATEACLMAIAATRRKKIVTVESLHPEYRTTLETYLMDMPHDTVCAPVSGGTADLSAVEDAVDDQTACLLVQHPNFFGCLEDVVKLGEIAKAKGAAFVVVVDPISLGLLKRPAEYGADIVVAEGQSMGIPSGLGGPGLGVMACREKFLRRMPGRLVGQTKDRREKPCFTLTLQTREQHIRRERATSNICTNQGLMALRAVVYLAAMGPEGLKETAELCVRKSHYAMDTLREHTICEPAFDAPFFKEFVVRIPDADVFENVRDAASGGSVLPGVPLGRWYADLSDCLLIAVTEKRTAEEIALLQEVFLGLDE